MPLSVTNAVVVGAGRGVGRAIALRLAEEDVNLLAIARSASDLADLRRRSPRIKALAADATDQTVPALAFERLRPDLVVVCGGAVPPSRPLQDQSFEELRDGRYWRAHSLHVLEVEHRHIARVTCFVRPMGPRLFASFGKSEI